MKATVFLRFVFCRDQKNAHLMWCWCVDVSWSCIQKCWWWLSPTESRSPKKWSHCAKGPLYARSLPLRHLSSDKESLWPESVWCARWKWISIPQRHLCGVKPSTMKPFACKQEETGARSSFLFLLSGLYISKFVHVFLMLFNTHTHTHTASHTHTNTHTEKSTYRLRKSTESFQHVEFYFLPVPSWAHHPSYPALRTRCPLHDNFIVLSQSD